MLNDGEYPWDARTTFEDGNLEAASDYSLMLWTESPPRQSISGYFSLGPSKDNITDDSEPTRNSQEALDCLDYLQSNGGYYNQSGDADFRVDILTQESLNNPATGFKMENIAIGSTTLSWSIGTTSPSQFQMKGLPINLIWQSTLGMGMVGLNILQKFRRSKIPEMDVVALDLGTNKETGSVVMGGYDDALINHNQKVTFSKARAEDLSVICSEVTYIYSSGQETVISGAESQTESTFPLAYDSPNIQLPREVLSYLLPLIGSPNFDEGLNGYVYPNTPRTDFSLRFTLGNGTSSASITIPASSLLASDTPEDNPLTLRTESGRTYLRLSPASDSSPAHLGRAFLQHAYVVNAPSTINRFLISAIPSPRPSTKSLVAASRSSITMFNSTPSRNDKPAIGPMVGGILGGIAVIFGGIATWIFIVRRRRARAPSRTTTVRFADTDQHSPAPLSYDYEKESKTATTSLSSFSRDIGMFPKKAPQELPVEDRELLRGLEMQRRRQSEGSTVARVFMGPYSPRVDDIEEVAAETQLQRTATVGRVYSGRRVAKVEGSPPQKPERAKTKSPGGNGRSHVRTASIGRICTPTSVEFPGSRRNSMRTTGSKDLLKGERTSDEEDVIKEEENEGGKRKDVRWSKPTGGRNRKGDDDADSDISSVFGLDAVTKDGLEFLTSTPAPDEKSHLDDDSSQQSTTGSVEGGILKASQVVAEK